MRLSLAWGVEPDELAGRMGSRALTEWQAYFDLAPEDERADRRHAMLMSLFANAHRDPKRRPFSERDFLPPWRMAPADDDRDGEEIADSITRAMIRETDE